MEPTASAGGLNTVFHITHWKAGSQWIRAILETVANERIVPPRVGEGQVLLDAIRPGGVYPAAYLTREQFGTINLPPGSRHFVVIRDLRDTLVSAYYSFRYSHAVMTGLSAEMRQRLNDLPLDGGMSYLLESWLPNCASIVASWVDSGSLVLRYRDLLNRDVELLEAALIDHCGLEVDREMLRAAITDARFQNKTGGRERGTEDLHSHERKAISGDWKEKLPTSVLDRFDDLYGSLNVAAGFEPTKKQSAKSKRGAPVHSIDVADIEEGFDAASAMFPHVLPLIQWLAFEFAALRQFDVSGKILDVGCRDGRFFHSVFKGLPEADGVETNAFTAELAANNRVYDKVYVCVSYADLETDKLYDVVIANGVVAAGDAFKSVVGALKRAMQPEGRLICSLRTNKYREWTTLTDLISAAGCAERAAEVNAAYFRYHNLENLLTVPEWCAAFDEEGLEVVSMAPLLPELSAKLCLFLDSAWHLTQADGEELGQKIIAEVAAIPGFSECMRKIVSAVYMTESDLTRSAGIILELRQKPR